MCELDSVFTPEFTRRDAECKCKPGRNHPCKDRCEYCTDYKRAVRR